MIQNSQKTIKGTGRTNNMNILLENVTRNTRQNARHLRQVIGDFLYRWHHRSKRSDLLPRTVNIKVTVPDKLSVLMRTSFSPRYTDLIDFDFVSFGAVFGFHEQIAEEKCVCVCVHGGGWVAGSGCGCLGGWVRAYLCCQSPCVCVCARACVHA